MRKQYNTLDFGPIIPIGPSDFGKAPDFPKAGEHPRLLFTKEMIPDIKKALDDPELAEVREALDDLVSSDFDGHLGIPYMHGVEGFPGRKGVHNFDAKGLISIESKAFAYAIWGDPEIGYKAIDAMQEFLLTLNIRFIFCDQCREFGHIMLTAAKVYDWCYDLMTEEEKHRIFAGVINYVASGECGMLQSDDPNYRNYGGTRKMEVGYPPKGQGCVTGHGSEGQVTRDYYSMAIAVYDEYPDWWEYVAARVFNDYIDHRNYYYKCGCPPQGNSCYGPYRLQFDFFNAFANKVLFGENPYIPEMGQTPRSLYSYELPNGQHFSEGDFVHGGFKAAAGADTSCALWASNLYGDRSLRAEVKAHRPTYACDYYGTAGMPPSEVFILFSDALEPAADRHEGVSPVSYNCEPQHKIIARERWDYEKSPVVFMKAGNRTTANHDHRDAGSFQLFYRGMLSVDAGAGYHGYGSSAHTSQLSTMAHNSILIRYPNARDAKDSTYGGQRGMAEAPNKTYWLETPCYDTANPEGVSYYVKSGVCDYAYIASDIAPAYNRDTEMDYLSRRMLSVFTHDEKMPLIYATYDSITARGEDGKKVILLHTRPGARIEGNTVTARNEEASLTVSYISDSELELCFYGDSEYTEESKRSWCSVEVSPKLGNLRDDVLAIMYAKDLDCDYTPSTSEIKTGDVLGAEIDGYALLFVRDLRDCPGTLSVETKTAGTYMISGLSVGKWTVSSGDTSIAIEVTESERFARFELPAGNITIKKN